MKGLSYILILVVILGSCNSATEKNSMEHSLDRCEIVFANDNPKVGMTLSIQLNCFPEITDTVQLLWSGTLSDRIFPVALEKGKGNISISGDDLNHSGVTTYQIVYHHRSLHSGSITIDALKPYGLLETYTGPKTIVAGGLEDAMIVAIPLDSFKNVANTDVVRFDVNTLEKIYEESTIIRGSTASKKLTSGDKIGKWYLAASVESGNSLEEHIYITPHTAEDFKIETTLSTPFADGRTISVISTSFIRDSNGNIISDGTYVNFDIMNGDQLVALYRAPTIGGVARLYFEHPDRPMQLNVLAHIANVAKSTPIKIKFDPFIQGITATYIEDDQIIQVGPLRGVLNQFLPDGYRVAFHIEGEDFNEWKYGMLEKGKYTLPLSEILFNPGSYEVNIYVSDQSQRMFIEWK